MTKIIGFLFDIFYAPIRIFKKRTFCFHFISGYRFFTYFSLIYRGVNRRRCTPIHFSIIKVHRLTSLRYYPDSLIPYLSYDVTHSLITPFSIISQRPCRYIIARRSSKYITFRAAIAAYTKRRHRTLMRYLQIFTRDALLLRRRVRDNHVSLNRNQ